MINNIKKVVHPDYPQAFMYAMKVPMGTENVDIRKEFQRQTGIPYWNFRLEIPDHFASDQEGFFPTWHDCVTMDGFAPTLGENEREVWLSAPTFS